MSSTQGARLARTPSAPHFPLHDDLVFLGQRRRRLVRLAHPQRLKRGVFTSIVELQTAIKRFIAEANQKPKPFV